MVGNHFWKIATYLLVDPNTKFVRTWIMAAKEVISSLLFKVRATESVHHHRLFVKGGMNTSGALGRISPLNKGRDARRLTMSPKALRKLLAPSTNIFHSKVEQCQAASIHTRIPWTRRARTWACIWQKRNSREKKTLRMPLVLSMAWNGVAKGADDSQHIHGWMGSPAPKVNVLSILRFLQAQ